MLIGEIEGTVSTSEFKFRAYTEIKKFDFVAVKKKDKWILAQVQEVKKYEDGRTEAQTSIIGYREKGLLKKPKSVIKPNSMIYSASQELISETLGLNQKGLYIGKLESNIHVKIHLDPESFYRHVAVLAQTGSGKSYLAGVIVEELLDKKYPVVIIDPHGEYHTLGEKNKISEEQRAKFEVEPKSYKIEEYTSDAGLNSAAKKLLFSEQNLKAQDIVEILPTSLTNSQLGILYTAIKELEGKNYTLDDILSFCSSSDSKAKWGLINLLELLKKGGIFSKNPTDLRTLVKEGQATIINLKGIPPKTQEVVVHLLAKNLFELRKHEEVKPFFMLIEESHNFIPERNIGKAICSSTLMSIASEGRKFGLGLIVVSQRPARIDNNVLSQCNTQIILRVTNPSDINAISKSFEGVTNEVKSAIRSLPSGVGLVLGKDYPIMTEIRVRRSKHGGETKTLSAESKKIRVFVSSFSKEYVEKALKEEVRQVYYPLWILKSGDLKIVLDAKNGELKYKSPVLGKFEQEILELTKIKPRTKNELIEKLEIGFTDLSSILENLINQHIIKQSEEKGKIKYYATKDYFSATKNVEFGDAKVIQPEIKQEIAVKMGAKLLKKDIDGAELVYYPYYATQNTVIDGLTGQKI